jgi:hypothetical protein
MGAELPNAVALEDIILSHPVELACRIFTNAFNLKYKLWHFKCSINKRLIFTHIFLLSLLSNIVFSSIYILKVTEMFKSLFMVVTHIQGVPIHIDHIIWSIESFISPSFTCTCFL